MKARLLREQDAVTDEYRQAKAEGREKTVPPERRRCTLPKDTVIDHPDAWRLVRLGLAVPDDDECREKAGLSDEQIAALSRKSQLLEQGRATGDPKYDAPRQRPVRRTRPAQTPPAEEGETLS